jgi:hypothetical protein
MIENRAGATQTRGAGPKKRFCATTRLVPAFAALPSALQRCMVGLQEPVSGDSWLVAPTLASSLANETPMERPPK